MASINAAEVQVLMDHPKGRGMRVSFYADTSVAQGFAAHWLWHYKSEASRIKQLLADDPQARLAFERNLAVVRDALEAPEASHARGMAVFSDAERGFLRAFALDAPVRPRMVLDEEFFVLPLVEAMLRQQAFLVVLSDTHHARLFAVTPAAERLLGDIDGVVPKRRRASGQRRGKEQGHHIDRHRRDAILHFQKELAAAVEKAWNNGAFRGIVLLGEHEVLESFRNRLPARIAAQVTHEARHAWSGQQPEISGVVRSVITQAMETHDHALMEAIRQRLETGSGVARGPQEVIEALRNGQAGSVVLGPDTGQVASRCTACGSLFAAAEPRCAYCGSDCEKTNLGQQILRLALRHNVPVHFVEGDAVMAEHSGVAAFLRRDEPYATPRATAAASSGAAR